MQHTRNLSDDRPALGDAAVVFIDLQSGPYHQARRHSPHELRNNVLALADASRLFRLPVVVTTCDEGGSDGQVLPELRDRLRGDVVYVPRPRKMAAWDHHDFVRAIRNTGRRQLIVSGIATDVCLSSPVLSALEEGFQVFMVTDASGSLDHESHGAALIRMSMAGAQLASGVSVVGDLLHDWRRDPEGLAGLFAEHVAPHRELLASHQAMRR